MERTDGRLCVSGGRLRGACCSWQSPRRGVPTSKWGPGGRAGWVDGAGARLLEVLDGEGEAHGQHEEAQGVRELVAVQPCHYRGSGDADGCTQNHLRPHPPRPGLTCPPLLIMHLTLDPCVERSKPLQPEKVTRPRCLARSEGAGHTGSTGVRLTPGTSSLPVMRFPRRLRLTPKILTDGFRSWVKADASPLA